MVITHCILLRDSPLNLAMERVDLAIIDLSKADTPEGHTALCLKTRCLVYRWMLLRREPRIHL